MDIFKNPFVEHLLLVSTALTLVDVEVLVAEGVVYI